MQLFSELCVEGSLIAHSEPEITERNLAGRALNLQAEETRDIVRGGRTVFHQNRHSLAVQDVQHHADPGATIQLGTLTDETKSRAQRTAWLVVVIFPLRTLPREILRARARA